MALINSTVRTQLRPMALALILVTLLLPTTLTAPASADREEERDPAAIAAAFDVLRTAIEDTRGLPRGPETAFLAKAHAAEVALLLPAVQSAREAAQNDQAAVQILTALQRHNHALSDELGYDGDAIDTQAETVKRYVLTDGWPK